MAIARFRLTLAALQACGLNKLEAAPGFRYHLAVGDSLWFGAGQQAFDFDTVDGAEAGLSGFAYRYEDRAILRDLLRPSRYDTVVGNPPYITVKDKALNAAYRLFYQSCSGTYAMTVPFMELFFRLAAKSSEVRPAGWVGQITSNSFTKREFGALLVEQFLPSQDLRLVIDSSGAFIPGHGTPTVIIVGVHQAPVGSVVRAVLKIRSEPTRPDAPAEGTVWRSIVEHVSEPGHDDGWTSTADLSRQLLARHPWSLSGGGAVEVLALIQTNSSPMRRLLDLPVGRAIRAGADEAFVRPRRPYTADSTVLNDLRPLIVGEGLRDWTDSSNELIWYPYQYGTAESIDLGLSRELWPLRTVLAARVTFQGSMSQAGLAWWEYMQHTSSAYASPLSIVFAEVSTHNHFILDQGGSVFKQSAPAIKLPTGTNQNSHLALMGILNSSTCCFWLRQICGGKGGSGIGRGIQPESWMERYTFNSTNVEEIPLPATLPLDRARRLNSLSQTLTRHNPEAVVLEGVPTRAMLDASQARYIQVRGEMIAQQEELDWEVYRLYGLIDEDLTHEGTPPEIALGERAFEIAMARIVAEGEEETAWFDRHGSTPISAIPTEWPTVYRSLVQRRLELIASDKSIRLLEKPEYKRRWSSESWEKQEERALRNWLLDRLEDSSFWFDLQNRPTPRSLAQLADDVTRDKAFISVLGLWEGRPDLPITASLTKLLAEETVPFLAAYRFKETGLRKRREWEVTWELQRREDAGEKLDQIQVPPKYTSADFMKASYWHARGKLDIPKERFILYPKAGRETDLTPVLGWAGWDHAQQALALNALIQLREQDGWIDERLIPLIAGLAELQPWIDQWHAEVDPTYGISLAAFCREQLATRSQRAGKTLVELAEWRLAPTIITTRRGRKPRAAGVSS